MALLALAFPILPGKKDKWLQMIEQFNGPAKADLVASRKRIGIHERTFLQETPMGDLVIVTFEGNDVQSALGKLMADPAMGKFMAQLSEIHGMDPNAPPPALPRLVFDSNA